MWWQYQCQYIAMNAIGFYWHEHTELALFRLFTGILSKRECAKTAINGAKAWPSRKSMGIQPLSRLYKNPLIQLKTVVFVTTNHAVSGWRYCKSSNSWQLAARGENSTCTWADWIPSACCWGATHKRVWSVFGSPFLRKLMFVTSWKTNENKPWLQTNTVITFRTIYYVRFSCYIFQRQGVR